MSDKISPLNCVEENWYREGLRFACTGCGKCCTGAPGYVWVTPDEIKLMADYLSITVEEFSNKYVRKVGSRLSLTEDPKSYDCVFLKGKSCELYEARPVQCRTFPWWPQNLESSDSWSEAARHCEGINDEAPLVKSAEIAAQRNIYSKNCFYHE